MAIAATKTKPAEDATAAPATPAKTPEIQPNDVQIEAGQFKRDVLVRAGTDMVSDDLRDPKIWRKVQANPNKALRPLDHLIILAADESWYVRALVVHGTKSEAVLAIEKVGSFRAISDALYNDGAHRVHFERGAFVIRRMNDGVRMDNAGYGTEAEAIRAIANLYPRAMH